MGIQVEYFHILDKVIDACVLSRYENNRNYYADYTLLNQINTLILKKFRESVSEKEMLKYLSQVFAWMVDGDEEFSYFYD